MGTAQGFRIAYSALVLAAARSNGCILHADGHDHGDTHAVVRVDDVMVLMDEIDKAMGYETQLRILQTGMDAVNTHLRMTDEAGVAPSRAVLKALMNVYHEEIRE